MLWHLKLNVSSCKKRSTRRRSRKRTEQKKKLRKKNRILHSLRFTRKCIYLLHSLKIYSIKFFREAIFNVYCAIDVDPYAIWSHLNEITYSHALWHLRSADVAASLYGAVQLATTPMILKVSWQSWAARCGARALLVSHCNGQSIHQWMGATDHYYPLGHLFVRDRNKIRQSCVFIETRCSCNTSLAKLHININLWVTDATVR